MPPPFQRSIRHQTMRVRVECPEEKSGVRRASVVKHGSSHSALLKRLHGHRLTGRHLWQSCSSIFYEEYDCRTSANSANPSGNFFRVFSVYAQVRSLYLISHSTLACMTIQAQKISLVSLSPDSPNRPPCVWCLTLPINRSPFLGTSLS